MWSYFFMSYSMQPIEQVASENKRVSFWHKFFN